MYPKRKPRPLTELNAGSMADIAFLLLIFFLVSTTVLSDQGIAVRLPPWDPAPPTPLNQDNVLNVNINRDNALMIEGIPVTLDQVYAAVAEFVLNPSARKDRPQRPNKAIISLQHDRSTHYEAYVAVYDALKSAYHEMWEQASRQQFQMPMEALSAEQQLAVRNTIPMVISEAEPTEWQ